ncbi:TPA: HNH endonuclease [Legionella pneumophila]|nr:HNH endonuclease [Legionella pneumophila]
MANYNKHKPALRIEFNHQCPYCHTREPEIGGSRIFHIDHYKPKSQFPELISDYNNLIYSCPDCNRYKGNYWPKLIDRMMNREIIYLRPPEQIYRHLDVTDHIWKAKTNKGGWNIDKLQLNSKRNIKRREQRSNLQKTILRLQKIQDDYRKHADYDERSAEFENEIADLEIEINSLLSKIAGPLD